MNIKSLLCLGIGVVSMPILTSQIVNAAEPNMPFTQQEQLQQDRITQWERQQRLEAANIYPTDYIELPKDVPSEQGTSFFVYYYSIARYAETTLFSARYNTLL